MIPWWAWVGIAAVASSKGGRAPARARRAVVQTTAGRQPLTIPSNLAGAFASSLPVAEDLRLEGVTDWGGAYVDTSARWTQTALARTWERGRVLVPAQAQELLDVAWTVGDAVATWKDAGLQSRLDAIAQGGLAVLDSMYSALGVVEAVPLIGAVAKIGLSIQRTFWQVWISKHAKKAADPGLRYDVSSDQNWQRDALTAFEAGDLTPIFLPRVRVEGFRAEKVVHPTIEKEREWLVVPTGPVLGLGGIPGGYYIPRMWQGNVAVPWSDYRPGATAAVRASWELARSSMAALVDTARLTAEWSHFWRAVEEQRAAWKGKPQGTVLQRALYPISVTPGTAGQPLWGTSATRSMADVTGAQIARIGVRARRGILQG